MGYKRINERGNEAQTKEDEMSYQVFADGKDGFNSNSAAQVADVAVYWEKEGRNPRAWAVADVGPGPVRMAEVKVSTIKKTAAALVSAMREIA